MTVKMLRASMAAFVSIPTSHGDGSGTKFCAKQNTTVTKMMSIERPRRG
jgi:hypothetical protein